MLISLSLDFRTADLATREKYHLVAEDLGRLAAEPLGDPIGELALISTCNRVEVLAVGRLGAAEPAVWQDLARRWMPTAAGARQLLRVAVRRRGREVVGHLFRIAAGLESQVLGDSQVLGQVRAAYRLATEHGTLGPTLHRLFDRALRTGKRVHHETGLTAGRVSVGAEAAHLAARRLAPLALRRCLVVGCGKTGERAARQLVKLGAADIVLINRTPSRALALAKDIWGRAAPMDSLHRQAAEADLVIVATGADRPILRADALAFCREQARTRDQPLLLIDLSVPRNIDPEVTDLAQVTLVDMDALHPPLEAAAAAREASVPGAEAVVASEIDEFAVWLDTAPGRSALQPLREILQDLCYREVAFAAGKTAADQAADRIVAKLLARPMIALRAASKRGEPMDDLVDAMRRLFGPPDQPGNQNPRNQQRPESDRLVRAEGR